jgi:hypothetical protein
MCIDSRSGLLLLCFFAAAGILAPPGSARGESIVNGGFETGNFSGWTQSGNTGATGVANTPFAGNAGAHSGQFWAALGPVGSDGLLLQSTATGITAGTPYTFSFWLSSDGGTPNDFSAKFDGVTLFSTVNEPVHNWVQHSFTVIPTSSTASVQFSFRNDPSYLGLDDVSLQPLAGAAVPTPIAGFGGVVLLGGLGVHRTLRTRRRSIA